MKLARRSILAFSSHRSLRQRSLSAPPSTPTGITSPPKITLASIRLPPNRKPSPPERASIATTAPSATEPTPMGDGHKKPSLRSEILRSATDGDLEWFLRQGDLAHGMPSWSSLPEAQRWQLVAYLRSIQ